MGRRVFDVRPLRVSAFARLWAASWVTAVGSQLTAVAVPLEIYGFSRSSAYVGLASLAGLAPMVVAALWGGAIADVVDRRRMLLVTSAGIAVTSALLWAQAAAGLKSVAVLLPLIAVQQAMFGANAAVGGAVVPRLVPSGLLPAANALQSMSVWFAGIAGPLLAGVLMPVVGARMLFLFDAIAMTPTLWAIARLPALPPADQAVTTRTGRARGRQIADGVGYLLQHQILLVAYLADFVTLFFGLPTALFPQIAHQRFGGPAAGGAAAGLLFAAISAGGVVAAVLAGLFSAARRPGRMMAAAAGVWAVAIAGFGVTPSLPASLALLVIAGGALMILGVFRKTILQAAAADHMRGRLQGMDLVVGAGGPRLASAAHGLIGAVLGTAWTVTGGGLLTAASMLILVAAFPGFARYQAGDATTRPTLRPGRRRDQTDLTYRTRTRATARPKTGWLAETTTAPAESGSDRIHTAPAPPAAVKSNGLSPTSTAGPETDSVTDPVTNGRDAPYRSTARNATRVASAPSPAISSSSAASHSESSDASDDSDRDMTSSDPRYPSIRKSGREDPSTPRKSTNDGGCASEP